MPSKRTGGGSSGTFPQPTLDLETLHQFIRVMNTSLRKSKCFSNFHFIEKVTGENSREGVVTHPLGVRGLIHVKLVSSVTVEAMH